MFNNIIVGKYSCVDSHVVPRLLCNAMIYCRVRKTPSLFPILRQISPVYVITFGSVSSLSVTYVLVCHVVPSLHDRLTQDEPSISKHTEYIMN